MRLFRINHNITVYTGKRWGDSSVATHSNRARRCSTVLCICVRARASVLFSFQVCFSRLWFPLSQVSFRVLFGCPLIRRCGHDRVLGLVCQTWTRGDLGWIRLVGRWSRRSDDDSNIDGSAVKSFQSSSQSSSPESKFRSFVEPSGVLCNLWLFGSPATLSYFLLRVRLKTFSSQSSKRFSNVNSSLRV